MKKKKLQKFELGTGKNGVVRHYVESPNETMVENDIMMAKAREKAADNGWAKGLDIFGAMAIQYGTSMMSSGGGAEGAIKTGINQGFGDEMNRGNGSSMYAAFGGTAGAEVEVEGKESARLPDGGFINFEGPSHEEGGIDAILPEGTDIFSKRITVKGQTMAEREEDRSKEEFSLQKLLDDNDMDVVLKSTLKRTQSNNAMEREKDKRLQEVIKLMHEMSNTNLDGSPTEPEKFEGGGTVMGNMFRGLFGGTDPDTGGAVEGNFNYTGGDLIGMAGTLYSAFEPGKNTERARAGDTPNINAFEDFGNDALDRINDAKTYLGTQRDNALNRNTKNRTTASNRNRKTATSVNTMRALDTNTDIQTGEADVDVYDNFAKQMIGILSTEAGLENEQDRVVMAGEDTRDDRDRRDRDNYFSQLAKDISTKGQGIQQVGKMMNQNKKNTVSENLLNDTSKGYKVDGSGNILLKSGKKELSVEESRVVLEKQAKEVGMTYEDYIKMLTKG